ncbi:sensor domain-containing diguanylate cyclase [Pseudomonas sp. KU43P]|uniref:sensor domain-containing diguanylate cyclase n=1 Tax=Pseudomonas sp. KU43P TaxID=2487887 RepID=UPI0012A9CBD2|nr:sensor domain-containing diguanylate cyclase [Pseudomonas sp. KU43P]BBH45864.1 cell signaling regulator [Pseudomonas sp. KU43P]
MPDRQFLGLRGLTMIFVLLAVLATLGICLAVAYGVQRDALIGSTLASNRAYASKVASSIGEFLRSAQNRLQFSSLRVADRFDEPAVLKDEALRLQAQDSELDVVMILDDQGQVLALHPDIPGVLGSTLTSSEVKHALAEHQPMVSQAYTSATGQLIVFISRPILDRNGKFLGVIGGAIHLQQHGVMHGLISHHAYSDGTYAFIADSNHRLLYHPNHEQIGQVITNSPTMNAALQGQTGELAAPNYQGIPMLAGYAYVPEADWAVVAQQPEKQALAPLRQLMREMLLKIVPAGTLGLLLILAGTFLITRPLRQLARIAADLSAPETPRRLAAVRGWYAEAGAIRHALLKGVQLMHKEMGQLNQVALSDPLTGLANRRAMDATLSDLDRSNRPYAALALDIDHFKRVNDVHGHDAGDRALQQIAQLIQNASRAIDLACRAGGEEFVLLLPDTSLAAATQVAERIRQSIADTPVDGVGALTISIGVACKDAVTVSSADILKRADEHLYLAKQTGRNRVVAASPTQGSVSGQ